jgi:erythritol kinase (D-erythritol 1-phosphate-forming)
VRSRREVLVGVDAGTSVVKAVAFDAGGRQLAVASRPNRYDTLPGGGVEQDMRRTWADAAAVLRELAERLDGTEVLALAVTGQGDGTWLVDAAGEPVGGGLLWLDSRAAGIVAELDRSGARAAVYRCTGCGLNACNQSSQLLWLRRHQPERVARAAKALHCKDWLYLNLTGERVTDVSEGTFTFGDFRARAYAPEVLDAFGLADLRRLLPEMVEGTCATHPLTPEAAALTGLPAGTPVSLGYVDVICTALGGGLYAPGRDVGCSIVGSTGMHMRLAERAEDVALAPEPTGYTMPFPVPGTAARMQSNMAATLNIDWALDLAREAAGLLTGRDVTRAEAIAALAPRVLDARPGAALFHPYIHEAGERGPFVDVNARAQLTGLSTEVSFLDLLRAVHEGLAFAARDCYGAVGGALEEVRLAGGAARSAALRTIFASALNAPVRPSAREEAGAAGAVMMAAVATGLYPDMAAACAAWVDPLLGEPTPPDPGLAALYDRLHPVYAEVHGLMRPVWADLAAARQGRGA